mgnify:CR=1 FL=1
MTGDAMRRAGTALEGSLRDPTTGLPLDPKLIVPATTTGITLKNLVDRYGVKQIGFVDPIFPLVKKDLHPFSEELARRGLDKKCQWLSETRCDRMDRETADMMYAGGCRRVLFGIESGSDMLLGNVNKNITTEKVRQGVAEVREGVPERGESAWWVVRSRSSAWMRSVPAGVRTWAATNRWFFISMRSVVHS